MDVVTLFAAAGANPGGVSLTSHSVVAPVPTGRPCGSCAPGGHPAAALDPSHVPAAHPAAPAGVPVLDSPGATAADLERLVPFAAGRLAVRRTMTADGAAYTPMAEQCRLFLRARPEWTAVGHDHGGGGLMLLSSRPEDKTRPPGLWRKARTYIISTWRHVLNGRPRAASARVELRLATCDACEFRTGGTCGDCGCPLAAKAARDDESCPLGRW